MNKIVFDKLYEEPKAPYNIVSVCVFVMRKAYKSNQTYVDGLKYTLENFRKFLPDFYLRIYFDMSVELEERIVSLLEFAKKMPHVQLVKFHHPWFVGDNGYHLGTFGTVVRLFPLFSRDEPKLKMILIGDIDYNEGMFPYWENTFKHFKKSSSQVHMFARDCNHLNERVNKIVSYLGLNISPFLNSFWSKIRFPYAMLDTFLKCLYDRKDINTSIGCNELDIFLTKVDYDKVKKANKMEKQKFMYGVDEICLLMMVKYVVAKKVVYSYHTFPDLLLPFRDAYAVNASLVYSVEHKDVIKMIMQKYYNNNKNAMQNFNSMYMLLNTYDNYLLPVSHGKLKMMVYFTKNIKDVYKNVLIKDFAKYGLEKKTVECIFKSTVTGLKLVNNK